MIWPTPSVLSKNACSLAWPPAAIAVSVSPSFAESTRIAASASEAPVIMFLIKSLWPGASINVKKYFGVSNFWKARSIVIPLSLSSLILSITQAYLKVSPFPVFSDSAACAAIVLSSTTPRSIKKWPIVVDFPLSIWPVTIRFKCGLTAIWHPCWRGFITVMNFWKKYRNFSRFFRSKKNKKLHINQRGKQRSYENYSFSYQSWCRRNRRTH